MAAWQTQAMSRLTIYLSSSGCIPCRRARELGEALIGAYPDVKVELVDVALLESGELPESVVAVPTYVLDGIVISMGNPREATLREMLASAGAVGG
jgi:hypothetical protein